MGVGHQITGFHINIFLNTLCILGFGLRVFNNAEHLFLLARHICLILHGYYFSFVVCLPLSSEVHQAANVRQTFGINYLCHHLQKVWELKKKQIDLYK